MEWLWIIVMFLSAVWTLILTAPIHCRASISVLMEIQSHLHLGWPEGEICSKISFLGELFLNLAGKLLVYFQSILLIPLFKPTV